MGNFKIYSKRGKKIECNILWEEKELTTVLEGTVKGENVDDSKRGSYEKN